MLQLNKDHMKGNDKQDHVQTWEFWYDNTVHTKKYNQSVQKVQWQYMMYIIYCYLEKHKNCLFDTKTVIGILVN